MGILASRHLHDSERAVFNPTDLERLDGHADHVCCSIQFPNVWYFHKAMQRERLFRDWVVILIRPNYLWKKGTKFCPRNASADFGEDIGEGPEAFEAMFEQIVVGARTFKRTTHYHPSVPTDQQAEVLIPDRIRINDLIGVVVQHKCQARLETQRLLHLGLEAPEMFIAAPFFDRWKLNIAIKSGAAVPLSEFRLRA